MPRRVIVSVQDIYRARACSWERHYERRMLARELISQGWNPAPIVQALRAEMNEPHLDLEGRICEVPIGERKASPMQMIYRLGWNGRRRAFESESGNSSLWDLTCVWYWSDSAWDDFVREFQALPEVGEDHYVVYNKETDCVHLVPMSHRPRRKYNSGTTEVQPKYNPCTTRVVVPENAGLDAAQG